MTIWLITLAAVVWSGGFVFNLAIYCYAFEEFLDKNLPDALFSCWLALIVSCGLAFPIVYFFQ